MQLPLADDECARLEALRSYRILDTPPEKPFDDLTNLAAYICGTPIALIGFLDSDRQWFKSKRGWDVDEIPRQLSFCSLAILQCSVMVVSDTLTDKRLGTGLLATHGGVRFYAGAPLVTAEGYALGTLSVMDCVPRGFTEEQTDALQMLAGQVIAHLQSRRLPVFNAPAQVKSAERRKDKDAPEILQESEALYRTVTEVASDAIIVIDEHSKILFVNRATEKIFGFNKQEVLGRHLTMLMPDYLRQVHVQALNKYVETGKRHLSWDLVELPGQHKNGKEVWLQISFGEFVHDGKHIFTGICRDITERKRADSERFQLAAIVESSSDAIIGKDLEGVITSWNKGAERIYGYSAREMIGKHVSILAPPERADEIPRILEKLKRGERTEPYESVRVTKGGNRIPVSLAVSPILDESGKILGASVVSRDISQGKQGEDARRAQEARLRLLVEQMPAVLWTVDSELRITSAAGAALSASGVRAEELIGLTLSEYRQTHGPDSPALAAHRQALQGNSVSYSVASKGHSFEAHLEQLRDSQDKVVGCIGVALDVSERLQAEEALRASEERYRSLFEGAVHGIYRVDLDGQFREVNPALVAMLGYDSPELLKLNEANVYADQEERVRLIEKWLETKRIEDEVDWKRRNGQVIRVRISGRILADQQGLVRGFECLAENITEQRALESQLRQAQKIEAVGQLAGGIAHEFNNFLGVILGYSELLSEEAGENESLRGKIAEIKAATQRAASLTRQLLTFSRKQVTEAKIVDLNQVIWETQNLLRRLVPANIDVVPVLAPTIGELKIDPGQVQQVLINLVVNARDAMPAGGKVVIETANVNVDEQCAGHKAGLPIGSFVMLSVRDTGCGMDAETRSHMFEPFFTTKEAGKGTGLGLSTIYGIVKQSGGHIVVESDIGEGTIFRMYWPPAQVENQDATEAPPAPTGQSGAGTILVVEDETALRRLLCMSLERRGYEVIPAKDGAEATEILRQQHDKIRLVVSDIMMPHVNGFELKQRAASLCPEMKFLFMSGYAEDTIQQRRELIQSCAFLEKPFLPDELATKVGELLRGEAAA